MVKRLPHELKKDQIEEMTNLKVIGEIPFDKNFEVSWISGKPLLWERPNLKSSKEIRKIAAFLLGLPYEEKTFLKKITNLFKKLI